VPPTRTRGRHDTHTGVRGHVSDRVEPDDGPVEVRRQAPVDAEPATLPHQTYSLVGDLGDDPAAGTEHIGEAGQQAYWVTTDPEVPVRQQREGPAALSGHGGEDVTAQRERSASAPRTRVCRTASFETSMPIAGIRLAVSAPTSRPGPQPTSIVALSHGSMNSSRSTQSGSAAHVVTSKGSTRPMWSTTCVVRPENARS
jgi:hypothetical protein